MRSIIVLSIFLGHIYISNLVIPAKVQSTLPLVSMINYKYKPSLHRGLWKNCDLYYVGGGYLGVFAPDTSIGVIGNHYFHSNGKRIHRLDLLDTDVSIIGAHSIFISGNHESGNSRITNYDKTVTIYNDKRSKSLERNETLLIDKDGKFEKFTNKYAGADSLWLTSGEIMFNNVGMATLINRMAINFGCKVQYNYQPSDERVVNALKVYFNCKSGTLLDGLQLLQSIAIGSQKFSYQVNNGIIIIDK